MKGFASQPIEFHVPLSRLFLIAMLQWYGIGMNANVLLKKDNQLLAMQNILILHPAIEKRTQKAVFLNNSKFKH